MDAITEPYWNESEQKLPLQYGPLTEYHIIYFLRADDDQISTTGPTDVTRFLPGEFFFKELIVATTRKYFQCRTS